MGSRWKKLNCLGKLNYGFFIANITFSLILILLGVYPAAMYTCVCAFISWLGSHADNSYKKS